MVISDHRSITVDFDVSILFGLASSRPDPLSRQLRGVRLNDAESMDAYVAKLTGYAKTHKILERCQIITRSMQLEDPTPEYINQLNKLDQEYGRYMIAAEKHTAQITSRAPEWSPLLHRAIMAVRYWKLIVPWQQKYNIVDVGTMDIQYITEQLSNAWKTYKTVKKEASTHRELYLQRGAQVRKSMGDGPASTILKQMLAKEKQKKLWARIKAVHHSPKEPLLSLLVPIPGTT